MFEEIKIEAKSRILKLLIADGGILIVYMILVDRFHRILDLHLTQELAGVTPYFTDKPFQSVSDQAYIMHLKTESAVF